MTLIKTLGLIGSIVLGLVIIAVAVLFAILVILPDLIDEEYEDPTH